MRARNPLRILLNNYVYRAVSLDVGRFSYLVRDEVVLKTLAGTTSHTGITLERLHTNNVVFNFPLIPILLTIGVVTSALATYILLTQYHKEKKANSSFKLRHVKALSLLTITLPTLLASVFFYYPTIIAIIPQIPPATFETPPYAYTCGALARSDRGAVAYTDFETSPLSGWTTSGGIWNTASGVAGTKGNVLQGQDNGGGIGSASYYYYNIRLDIDMLT